MDPAAALVLALAVSLAAGAAMVTMRRHCNRKRMDDRLTQLLSGAEHPAEEPRRRAPRRLGVQRLPRRLRILLDRADVVVTPVHLASLTLVLGTGTGAAAVFAGPLIAAAVPAAAVPVALGWLYWRAARRMRALFQALPGFLDNLRQLVAAGNSLQQAFEKTIENAPDVIAVTLRPMLYQLRHGVPLADSLTMLAERLDVVELHMLAASIQSNLRFGGRISDMLANLARTYRDHVRVERELRAATEETRASSRMLAALPVAAGIGLGVLQPSYTEFFLFTEGGRWLLAGCVLVQAAGMLLMRRLMRVDY